MSAVVTSAVGAPAVMPANSERGTAEDRGLRTENRGLRTELLLELVVQRLPIVAVLTLPHQLGRNVVGNRAVVYPAQRGHRGLDEAKGSTPSAHAASFGITQLCHVDLRPVGYETRTSELVVSNTKGGIATSRYAQLYAAAQSTVRTRSQV